MITLLIFLVYNKFRLKQTRLIDKMVEVTGLIVQRCVFLAGETVYCEIIFTNRGSGPCSCHLKNGFLNGRHKTDNCEKHSSRHLAWASAQIHCQCNVSASKVKFPSNKLKQDSFVSSEKTSFIPTTGEKGYCYLSTTPKILFCNLDLKVGQEKSFLYSDKLPFTAPPSYPGQHVKFSYKVTIGIGRLDSPTCLLKLPIRVLDCHEAVSKLASSSLESTVSNPFLQEESISRNSLLDVFSDYLLASTSRRNNNTYNIWSTHGSVGKFSIPKLCYRLGEDIIGTFDFTHSAVKCIKYSASLKLEELINEPFLHERQIGRNKASVSFHGRIEESCCCSRISYFSLHIPLTMTPGFQSDIVNIQWKLQFEFTTLRLPEKDPGTVDQRKVDYPITWKVNSVEPSTDVPDNMDVETMTWDLPLRIFSTNPDQVSLSSPREAKAVILLT